MSKEKIKLTEKHDTIVFKNTTILKSSRLKKNGRNKSDLGPEFVAPDAGWAWVVCIAAGFSNFCIYPALQQYGLIYKKRMTSLNNKEITTILNAVFAFSSIVGIVNGAMFRRFTFRQVAIVGCFLCFIGIFTSTFATTFMQYIICLSCIYGIGLGLSVSANSLAVNTYFKKKRRISTGFKSTITGLGTVFFPHICTFLLEYYGAQGTILIISAVALNSALCAITLQPVLWHTRSAKSKQISNVDADEKNAISIHQQELNNECDFCIRQRKGKHGISYSQFPFIDDDPEMPDYEITDMLMLARANDGWFSSPESLAAIQTNIAREVSGLVDDHITLSKFNYFNRKCEDYDHYSSKLSMNNTAVFKPFGCTCAETRGLIQKRSDAKIKSEEKRIQLEQETHEVGKSKITFGQKVVGFLDLDLLKDFTFVNLALGMTVMMFGEMNFSVLTPFILNSYNYNDSQITLVMSLLAGMDILVRFSAPLALEKVKFDNRTLVVFGIIISIIARFIVTLTKSYEVMLVTFVLIGFGKGFRTIFSPLIITSYVPLDRLPAASGMQCIFNAIFTIIFGAILGVITDATSFTGTIHFFNALAIIALLVWAGESVVRRMQNRGIAAVPTVDA